MEKIKRDYDKLRTRVSFSGCGFMSMYYVGVGLCFQERVSRLFDVVSTIYGASAGSIVAVMAACDIPAIEGYKFLRELYDRAQNMVPVLGRLGVLHPKFDLSGRVRTMLERVLPKDAHRRCRSKIGVSLTIIPSMKNWLVTEFSTRAELIQAVVCSCYIPGYCGINVPMFRGKKCCDGGLSETLPYSSDPNIITVSPFTGECDVCPRDDGTPHIVTICKLSYQMSLSNLQRAIGALFFLPWKEMESLFQRGYEDALNFAKREGLISYPLQPLTTETVAETTPSSPIHDDSSSDYYSMESMETPGHSRHSSLILSQDSLLTLGYRETPVPTDDEWEGLEMKVQRPMGWHFDGRYREEIAAMLSGRWKCVFNYISQFGQEKTRLFQQLMQILHFLKKNVTVGRELLSLPHPVHSSS